MSVLLATCVILSVTPGVRPGPNPHDADTTWVQCEKRKKPIELRVPSGDAPEFPAFTWGLQPGAIEARNYAIKVCPPGGPAKVRLIKLDGRTKRWVASVECNGVDLSEALAAAGWFWPYLPLKGSKVPALVKQAQLQQVGLWVPGATPIAPSEWRKRGLHQCKDGSALPKCP